MGMLDWFSRKTPLQLAIERGLKPDGDLSEELEAFDDFVPKTKADAEAICHGIAELIKRPIAQDQFSSPLRDLIVFFQQLDTVECDAFPVLAKTGMELLSKIVELAISKQKVFHDNDVEMSLKMLAMYRTELGVKTVLKAIQQRWNQDGYLWSVILSNFSDSHPGAAQLFSTLSKNLPIEFCAIALLDAANQAFLAGYEETPHPFDTDQGVQRLRAWLTDPNPGHHSYAVSTCAALPFLKHPQRDELISLGLDHDNTEVQIEAAWVTAKLGREAGFKWLARCCLDVNQSSRARHYLEELNASHYIPPTANENEFRVRAEFANWLAHPNELAQYPDEVDIYDHRILNWPPDYEPIPLWLVRYRLRDRDGLKPDDVGVGMVGSVMFCLFGYHLEQRPPEDGYAIHCAWELECNGHIREESIGADQHEYDYLLQQYPDRELSNIQLVEIYDMGAKLQYPQSLVGLATAQRRGEQGWVVLDGPRSRWYPESDFPEDNKFCMLKLHVGRYLLGFQEEPDRRKYLLPKPQVNSADLVNNFRKLLEVCLQNPAKYEKYFGCMGEHIDKFNEYITAAAALERKSYDEIFMREYERLFPAVHETPTKLKPSLVNVGSSLFGDGFNHYARILISQNRKPELAQWIKKLIPACDHNSGYGFLGEWSFKLGDYQTAETLLTKLKTVGYKWYRWDEMNYLAEIWVRNDQRDKAQQLLLDSIFELKKEIEKSTGDDRDTYQAHFESRRETFLRLFGPDSIAILQQHGLA